MNEDMMNYNDRISIYISNMGLYLDPIGRYWVMCAAWTRAGSLVGLEFIERNLDAIYGN